MKWIAFLVLAATACQRGEAKQGAQVVNDAYRADITTLCDVMKLSGADQQPKEARSQVIAMYLGPQIKTTEAHNFLVAIQPLQGEKKAAALEREAERVGLAKCELANEWR